MIRVPIGGYLNGGAIYHSQCGEVEFTHIPGLARGDALERAGCLRPAAHRDALPTIRCCSSSTSGCIASHTTARRIPGADFTIPFGRARVVKPGAALTVVTYGALVQKALLAAAQIERRDPDVSIEILDLRTLAPYDWAAIRSLGREDQPRDDRA